MTNASQVEWQRTAEALEAGAQHAAALHQQCSQVCAAAAAAAARQQQQRHLIVDAHHIAEHAHDDAYMHQLRLLVQSGRLRVLDNASAAPLGAQQRFAWLRALLPLCGDSDEQKRRCAELQQLEQATRCLESKLQLIGTDESREQIVVQKVEAERERLEQVVQELRLEVDTIQQAILATREKTTSLNAEFYKRQSLIDETEKKIQEEKSSVLDQISENSAEIERLREQRACQTQTGQESIPCDQQASHVNDELMEELNSEIELVQAEIKALQSQPLNDEEEQRGESPSSQCDQTSHELSSSIEKRVSPFARAIRHLIDKKCQSNMPFAVGLSILHQQPTHSMLLDEFKEKMSDRFDKISVIQTVYEMVGEDLIHIDRTQPQAVVNSCIKINI